MGFIKRHKLDAHAGAAEKRKGKRMKELLKKIRYKLAYLIAPDWIDDLEYRFSIFLDEQTGGLLSDCYCTGDTMRSAANDYRMRQCDECKWLCDRCEYYIEAQAKGKKNENR